MSTGVKSSFVFDSKDSASPSSVPPAQTAIFLMDYIGFTLKIGGEAAKPVLQKAIDMRDWALKNGVLPIHFVFDASKTPPKTIKGYARLNGYVQMLTETPAMGEEPAEMAPKDDASEPTMYRTLGHISALKSFGILELLEKRNIKSIIMCGISTSGCVLRTICDASDREYIISTIEDACWDPVPGMHEMLLNHTLTNQSHIATAEEFQKVWQ